jgi:hypothetical protein
MKILSFIQEEEFSSEKGKFIFYHGDGSKWLLRNIDNYV